MTECISLPYACNTDGRASAIPLALWSTDLQIEAGMLDSRPQLTFKPVVGAYVACVRVSATQTAPIDPCNIRYGRTNEVGWIVMRELDALGEREDVPSQPYKLAPAKPFWFMSGDDPVMFERGDQCADPGLLAETPNQSLRIFWCLDKSLFMQFATALEQEPTAALDDWGARTFKVQPFGEPASLKGLDLLSDKPIEEGRPDYTERQVAARLLFAGDRQGYHAGTYFQDHRTAAIFDATPASLRALFVSEWLEWYTAQLRADENWRTLMTALHVSAIAEQGTPVEEFERQIRANIQRTLGPGGKPEPRIFPALADYRRYAHDCAKVYASLDGEGRIDLRAQYIAAITVDAGGRWQEDANLLRKTHNLVHPWHTNKHRDADLLLDSEDEQEPLIAYFDYYAEGLRCKADGLTARIQGAMPSIEEAFEWIAQKRRQLVQDSSWARHDQLMRDVGLCRDSGQCRDLMGRHARQCAALGVPWWVDADEKYLATQTQWENFVAKLPWLSAMVNGVGDALGGFLNTHASLFQHTPATARALVRLCLRYERWITAGITDPITLPMVSGRWNIRASGKAFAFTLEVGNRSLPAGKFTVLEELKVERSKFVGPTGHVKRTSYRKITDIQLAELNKRPPPALLAMDLDTVERLEGKAGVISTLGATLDIALSLRELSQAPEVTWELFTSEPMQVATWSALQGVESTTQLITTARSAQGLAPLSTRTLVWASRAGGLGVAFEGGATAYQGWKTLYTDEGDLMTALDRGEETRASLELTKGVSQLAMGVGGLFAGVAGMLGCSLVAGPFGILFGVGSIAVAVVQIAIYVHTGGGNRVEPLIEEIKRAEQSEFHLDARGHETTRSPQPVRLRQRVAVLNQLLERASPRT